MSPTFRLRINTPVKYQENVLYNNSFSLIVGINHYSHERIPDLKFAENDAKTVASVLPALGFPKTNIKLLLGEQTAVTREVIQEVLEKEFNPKMEEGDRFLFYFAGHGVSYKANKRSRGYMLMQDSEIVGKLPNRLNPALKKIPAKSLEMGQFLNFIESLPVKHKLLLLDACFSGFMRYERSIPVGPADISKKLIQWTNEPATQVLTAGRSGQKVYEKEADQHGVFTRYLLKGLEGHADPRGDGIISFLDLAAYIRDRVAREIGVEQDPQFGTYEGEGHFFFLYGPPPKNTTAVQLPDVDKELGKAVSDTQEAHPSPYGAKGHVRRYEKGSLYHISKRGKPEPARTALKDNTFFRVLNSPIGFRYEAVGGSRSKLGFPTREKGKAWDSRYRENRSSGSVQSFEGGKIYYCERYGAHVLLAGRIRNAFIESETETGKTGMHLTGGMLGFPISEQMDVRSNSSMAGSAQRFEYGLIIDWKNGAFRIIKGFYDTYLSMGEWRSDLGFPSSNDEAFSSSISGITGSIQYFETGCMIWDEKTDRCRFLAGEIFSVWNKSKEKYGFPINNPYHIETGWEQSFEDGTIRTKADLFKNTSNREAGHFKLLPRTEDQKFADHMAESLTHEWNFGSAGDAHQKLAAMAPKNKKFAEILIIAYTSNSAHRMLELFDKMNCDVERLRVLLRNPASLSSGKGEKGAIPNDKVQITFRLSQMRAHLLGDIFRRRRGMKRVHELEIKFYDGEPVLRGMVIDGKTGFFSIYTADTDSDAVDYSATNSAALRLSSDGGYEGKILADFVNWFNLVWEYGSKTFTKDDLDEIIRP